MLLHPCVNYSTVPAEFTASPALFMRNAWLQCSSMRIELPTASWAETLLRAEEDAHTLTVADMLASDPFTVARLGEAVATLHAEVPESEPVTVTITF